MLTTREHMALNLAGQRFRPGALETAVRTQLSLSEPRFWQLVNALLDDPRALAEHPQLVSRLRRIRERRRSVRRGVA